ncbi:MAG TPA: hypothetical protein VK457_08195 [Chloroflexota bacterium]|nr:hypothetical protein [Chloroflexota bacterium]
MHPQLLLKEPLERVLEDWDFFQDRIVGRFSTFRPQGQNIYGIRRRHIGPETVVDSAKGQVSRTYYIGPGGLTSRELPPLSLHLTPAGTPHHTEHNYGYWHINDMDELSLKLPSAAADALGYSVLCMGNPGPAQTDRFAWYCEHCLTLMFERQYDTGDLGFSGFWRAERDAVAAYNNDPRNQACPECGHVNPQGYCWNAAKDSPEERLARQAW